MNSEKCIICGSGERRELFPLSGLRLLECRECGLQFLSAPPAQEVLGGIYANYYSSWNLDSSRSAVSAMKKGTFLGYLERLATVTSGGTFLDVGCATGEMLEVAAGKGFDVYGAEISPYGIEVCSKKFGADRILGKTIEKGDFPAAFFDVITLSDVFEHLPDPARFRDTLENILKPGGILMIVTPDAMSRTRSLLGRHWPHYKPEHLYYFNRSNLPRLFAPIFEVMLSEPAHKTLTLDYAAGVLNSYSENRGVRMLAGLARSLPERLKTTPFRIRIGEMMLILKKRGVGDS